MGRPINPNSAFVRTFFDLPTEDAIRFENAVNAREDRKAKRVVLTEIVQDWIAKNCKKPAAKKGRAK